jgi:4-aminobutyrate aminotransferase-like enzyme
VPVLGHAHPTVVQAISRQSALLNVSSRYLHRNIVELAERIAGSMPDPLDTVVFANSGSEANDLAWRMATTYTGANGAMIVEWGYHGISAGTVDFSSNEWPADHHPRHVATFRAPHADLDCPTPGRAEAHARAGAAGQQLDERGFKPALLLVDCMFTSEGILDASPGYVRGLVDAAHDAGALFLADEVQAGFGRTGPQLWRFAGLGVVPDIVTLGKPMGSGHPVSALVTTREIAERFARAFEFFSTFAGNPVSCAAALAVLDVLEQEQIPAQAVRVGEHLRGRLRSLAARHPVIKAVRGTGLVAGVHLGGDGIDGRMYAAEVVEALKAKGCLVGATGPGRDVLKIRPPLVWTEEHADLFADRLGEVLAEAAVPAR